MFLLAQKLLGQVRSRGFDFSKFSCRVCTLPRRYGFFLCTASIESTHSATNSDCSKFAGLCIFDNSNPYATVSMQADLIQRCKAKRKLGFGRQVTKTHGKPNDLHASICNTKLAQNARYAPPSPNILQLFCLELHGWNRCLRLNIL